MATIKEEAEAYEAPKLKNIADLEKVPTDLEILEEKETEYPYKYVVIEGERYRIPVTVLSALKAHLKVDSDLKFFRVVKSGEGRNTEYTVIPLSK